MVGEVLGRGSQRGWVDRALPGTDCKGWLRPREQRNSVLSYSRERTDFLTDTLPQINTRLLLPSQEHDPGPTY